MPIGCLRQVHQDLVLGRTQPTRPLKVITKDAGQHKHQAHQAAPDELLVFAQGRDIHTASLSYGTCARTFAKDSSLSRTVLVDDALVSDPPPAGDLECALRELRSRLYAQFAEHLA